MYFDFSSEAHLAKQHSLFIFNNVYPLVDYYRPFIEQDRASNLLSSPTTLVLKKLFKVPALIRLNVNTEILSKYNLVSDPYDLVAIFPILAFEKINTACLQGDIFEYLGIKYEILKAVQTDFYKNTRIPLHYTTVCLRYLQPTYVKDIDSETKNIVPAKTGDQYDNAYRDAGWTKDPDNPDYIVRN